MTEITEVVTGLAMAGLSVPVFVVAPVAVLVFAVYRDWLPASFGADAGAWRYLLPVTTLALPQIGYIARLMRASLIEFCHRTRGGSPFRPKHG